MLKIRLIYLRAMAFLFLVTAFSFFVGCTGKLTPWDVLDVFHWGTDKIIDHEPGKIDPKKAGKATIETIKFIKEKKSRSPDEIKETPVNKKYLNDKPLDTPIPRIRSPEDNIVKAIK